jgi:NADH-quinone oxidoreductase subunit E
MLSEETRTKIKEEMKKFPEPRSIILPALWYAQEEKGHLSRETCMEISEITGQHMADILSVLTFYTMYNEEDTGKYHIQVCRTLSCWLRGSSDITAHLCKKLGVKPGEITPDGKFRVTEVECLGSCGTAPMFQVNDKEYYEDLTPEKVDQILETLK